MKDERDVYFGKVLASQIDFDNAMLAPNDSTYEEKKRAFARAMNVDMNTLDGWLSGEVHMPSEDYLRMCEIIKIPPEDIFGMMPDDMYDSITYDGDRVASLAFALQELVEKDERQIYQALRTVKSLVKEVADAVERINYFASYRVDMLETARRALRGDPWEES